MIAFFTVFFKLVCAKIVGAKIKFAKEINFKVSIDELLKKVNNNRLDHSIADEFLKWDKVGTKKLAGLTRRRIYEADNYFKE